MSKVPAKRAPQQPTAETGTMAAPPTPPSVAPPGEPIRLSEDAITLLVHKVADGAQGKILQWFKSFALPILAILAALGFKEVWELDGWIKQDIQTKINLEIEPVIQSQQEKIEGRFDKLVDNMMSYQQRMETASAKVASDAAIVDDELRKLDLLLKELQEKSQAFDDEAEEALAGLIKSRNLFQGRIEVLEQETRNYFKMATRSLYQQNALPKSMPPNAFLIDADEIGRGSAQRRAKNPMNSNGGSSSSGSSGGDSNKSYPDKPSSGFMNADSSDPVAYDLTLEEPGLHPIRDLNATPWRQVALISFYDLTGALVSRASGVLVGPSTILTLGFSRPDVKKHVAARAFFSVQGMPDLDHSATVAKIRTFPPNPDLDPVMMMLNLSTPIGNELGYVGVAEMGDSLVEKATLILAGYPAFNRSFGTHQLTASRGTLLGLDDKQMYYSNESGAGMGGGPILYVDSGLGAVYLAGIHVGTEASGRKYGTRITREIFEWIGNNDGWEDLQDIPEAPAASSNDLGPNQPPPQPPSTDPE